MINKSTFDTIHAGKFVLHSYLINDINGCKGTIYIRIHCLLYYIIIMRFLCQWALKALPQACGSFTGRQRQLYRTAAVKQSLSIERREEEDP